MELIRLLVFSAGGGDVLMKMLVSYTLLAQQVFEDTITAMPLILLCGGNLTSI